MEVDNPHVPILLKNPLHPRRLTPDMLSAAKHPTKTTLGHQPPRLVNTVDLGSRIRLGVGRGGGFKPGGQGPLMGSLPWVHVDYRLLVALRVEGLLARSLRDD